MNKEVTKYYDKIALEYDDSRFSNTYGQFIDQQEKRLMEKWLGDLDSEAVLELGCGTGRFLEFANYGVDVSEEMLAVAKNKFSEKQLFVESAAATHFEDARFEALFSFHVFMHLDKNTIAKILDEAHRVLKKGGRFIFDVPSKKRRQLVNYKSANWHGSTDFFVNEISEMTQGKWKVADYSGVLFFPIHKFPTKIRSSLLKADNLFCHSIFKEYSSYLIFVLEKI